MSTLSREDVLHLAVLANLPLSDQEIDTYTNQLGHIVEHFTELKEIDTEHTQPTSQVTGLIDVTRPDAIDTTRILTQEEALSGTENTENGYIVVDYVFEDKQS
ncbi:Asp-tRNA(Asn)/Glu-tRNA(Gln) amidotransferase subunit GatC [Candidatus Woesebacteria bacterium]|nr:Asp-tRNA(Asn)/Glu-tRNA(Gln) amidotransferase subunit GatC [Candidatus Woesebacteria bacterium]